MRKNHDPQALRSLMDALGLGGLFDEKTEAAMELYAFAKDEIICSVACQNPAFFGSSANISL